MTLSNESGVLALLTNRSLRAIRTELDFLVDAGAIDESQLSNILSNLPVKGHAPLAERSESRQQQESRSQASPAPIEDRIAAMNIRDQRNVASPLQAPAPVSAPVPTPTPAPAPAPVPVAAASPPPANHTPPMSVPPPSYQSSPVPPPLCYATAAYAYQPQKPGDLALLPNDPLQVQQYLNPDWWLGRNDRTGLEGIFPRVYVNVSEKPLMYSQPVAPTPASMPTNYGNMPLEVAQSGSNPPANEESGKGKIPGKLEGGAKKVGKKFGNAAIFGAGATAGGELIHSIF